MNIPLKSLKVFVAIFLVLAVASAAFFPSLKNGFVNWDDPLYVLENPAIRSFSADNILRAFDSFFVGNYQPLTILSYALDYRVHGLRPGGYHATNLFVHLANCLLVFGLALLLGGRVGVACLTALLFGIHPLHAEAVAWVSGRKDVLYAFFFFGALLCYVRYLKSGGDRRCYYAALVFFLCALLSKAMAVTLPLVLFLLDRYAGRKEGRLVWADKVPFFVLALIFGVVALSAQHAAGAVRPGGAAALADKIPVALFSVLFYLYKTVWPVSLSNLYAYFVVPKGSFALFSFLILCAAGGVVLLSWRARRSRVFVFGGLFFLVTLLPVLQFVSLGAIIVAERYMYVPLFGIVYGLSEGMSRLCPRGCARRRGSACLALAILAAAALGALTWERCAVWKDSGTLWRDVLAHYPRSPIALNDLGTFYAGEGRLEEAAGLFRAAVAVDPVFADANNNLCKAETRLGRTAEALAACGRAIDVDPRHAESHVLLGLLYYRQGDLEAAAAAFGEALAVDPGCAAAYNDLGILAAKAGRRGEAAALFKTALALEARNPEARRNLALVAQTPAP
ncbi:MAG: tetratricopeptide repeat protein [Deltaproteobacteria bacterium]